MCIQITVALCKIEIERQKKSHKEYKNLSGSSLAYIYRRCQGEKSLTKKGDYNSSTLTKPKTQIQLKSYLTHNRETYSRISKSCGTYSLFLKVQLSHNNIYIYIYTPNNKLARAARETPYPNRNRC